MDHSSDDNASSLSDGQEKALSILPFFPAILSIFGSTTIIYLVFKAQFKTPYKRILLGTSLCDLVASITYCVSPFLLPQESSQHVWAFGTDNSCLAMGALMQFSNSAFFYQGFLSYYYLFTIRFGIRQETFAKRCEWSGHILSVGYPLVTAIAGWVVGVFHESELSPFCWVNDYPDNCGSDEIDTAGPCKSVWIAWIFGGIPVFLIFLSIVVNNLVVFLFVKRTIVRGRRSSTFSVSSVSSRRRIRGVSSESDSEKRRIRSVAVQALLYVTAFLFAYTWPVVLNILASLGFDDKDNVYAVLVLQATVTPLLGFLNLAVYLRPRYLQCRSSFPRESKLWCYRRALYGVAVQPTKMAFPISTVSGNDGNGDASSSCSMAASSEENVLDDNDRDNSMSQGNCADKLKIDDT